MNALTDKEIIDVALKHCDFTPEGTYHMRKFSGWAITQVVRECLELQALVLASSSPAPAVPDAAKPVDMWTPVILEAARELAAKPETQGERALADFGTIGTIFKDHSESQAILLLSRMAESITAINGESCWDHISMFDLRDEIERLLDVEAALLSAGPARVEPLTEALLYCRDDYNYLIGITENKDNLHGWLRMRKENIDALLNKKGGE